MMKLFCTGCYSVIKRGDVCACADRQSRQVLLGAPDEKPSMIGHLTLLDDTPRPWSLMEELCDGPRRYPDRVSAEAHCCCWRHRARTVWVWQENAVSLPHAGMRPEHGSPSMSLLRVMAETGQLLIEAPQRTPLFRAHYARNKSKGGVAPDLSLIIDRLLWAFSLSAARARAIALLDMGDDASAEDRARLKGVSSAFGVFKQRTEALLWLLEKTSHAPRVVEPARQRSKDEAAQTDDQNAARYQMRNQARRAAKKEEGKQPEEPGTVYVVDVGGSVGRHLLARLHVATWAAVNSNEAKVRKKAVVKLPGRRWPQTRFHADITKVGVSYGQIHRDRQSEPAPGSPVPPWKANMTGWWKKQPFTLKLEDGAAAVQVFALIVGVGPSRLFGERELARLLERVWLGYTPPAAIVRHAEADEHVLRWVRNEFPQTPEFPDSTEGGLRALETALREIRRRASR